MKKLLILFFVGLLSGCSNSGEGIVTILHTNDIHTQFLPMKASWVRDKVKPEVGGMIALQSHVAEMREKYQPSILLDAGDFMTGTPLAKIEVEGAMGGGLVQMMNILKYDAGTIGNHEFDDGPANIKKLIELANFDLLSSNLFWNDDLLAPHAFKIIKSGSVKIGIIGVALQDLAEVVNAKNLAGVVVKDPVKSVQKLIDQIDLKTDLIIILSHQGHHEDVQLAEQIRGADIIVGGHSHTRLVEPDRVNGILVVQAGSKTTSLGRLTVDVKGDSVASFEYELMNTWVEHIKTPQPEMAACVQSFQSTIDSEYGRTIGKLKSAWIRSSRGESNLGNFLTDVVLKSADADFAVLNSGGIRKNLEAGPIRKLDVIEVLPFTNTIVTFECTGEQLLGLIHENARARGRAEHGMLQVSNISYRYRLDSRDRVVVTRPRIGGKMIEKDKLYIGATVDFVLDGQAERYFGFNPEKSKDLGILISDAVVEYIERNPEIDSRVEGRIVREY